MRCFSVWRWLLWYRYVVFLFTKNSAGVDCSSGLPTVGVCTDYYTIFTHLYIVRTDCGLPYCNCIVCTKTWTNIFMWNRFFQTILLPWSYIWIQTVHIQKLNERLELWNRCKDDPRVRTPENTQVHVVSMMLALDRKVNVGGDGEHAKVREKGYRRTGSINLLPAWLQPSYQDEHHLSSSDDIHDTWSTLGL